MPRPRTPKAKARATGQDIIHPERFRNRKEPLVSLEIGKPPKWMTAIQRQAWDALTKEIPWLNCSHRALLSIASIVRASMMAREDVPIAKLNLLRQCLGQMGATPTDSSKVWQGDDEPEDPIEHYFN